MNEVMAWVTSHAFWLGSEMWRLILGSFGIGMLWLFGGMLWLHRDLKRRGDYESATRARWVAMLAWLGMTGACALQPTTQHTNPPSMRCAPSPDSPPEATSEKD